MKNMHRWMRWCCVLIASLAGLCAGPAFPQFGGGGFGGGFGGGGFGGGGGNNQNQNGLAGIAIDAAGVVTPAFQKELTGRLDQKRLESLAAAGLPSDVNVGSELRKVSLVRLEEVCRKYAEEGEHAPPEMLYLAGLQRIDYVFLYPETGDLVIAGPAEGFAPNEIGRTVGVTTGRPPLRLDDLIVALRTVGRESLIGCSIDPQPENLARFNDYVRRNSSATTTDVIVQRFREMTQVLGMQTVSVYGVPDDCHFAQVLVEADYRMKLISVGLERPSIKRFRSHLQMAGNGGNTLQRWWFTPLYDAFRESEDGNAWQFSGQRVQLMSQNEQINAAGQRSDAAFKKVSVEKFSEQFTERYEELAAATPVFAELQNVIDLSILAALIQREELATKANWRMSVFKDASRPLPHGNTPKSVQSVCNYQRSGRVVVGLVGGGVSIRPEEILRAASTERGGNRELDQTVEASAPRKDASNWWWD